MGETEVVEDRAAKVVVGQAVMALEPAALVLALE